MELDFFILIPVLFFSIVVHEVAHAWQARREGDDTAEKLGRITLNPLPHIDPFGSVLLPLLLYFGNAPFLFGWAKPVPVNPTNYRSYPWGDIRVSLAGIVSNLGLAVMFTLIATVVAVVQPLPGGTPAQVGAVLSEAAYYGIFINLLLAFFNLIPIPPLDGSHVLYHLLPAGRVAEAYKRLARFGIILVFALVFFAPGAFRFLMSPVYLLMDAAQSFVGLWA
jgi:Zn-dependent protease